MNIYLIRHGMTPLGEQKKYQGALDTSLSEEGKKALREADLKPRQVYVTGLKRTAETAAVLFPGVKQVIAEGLREMDFGVFEGRSAKDMEEDAAYREWVGGNCSGTCPGGEDRGSFSARVCEAFAGLVDTALRQGEEELVVVAHGGTQMAVLEHWGGSGKAYYEWQTPCGAGWLLDTENWPAGLRVLQEIYFTEETAGHTGMDRKSETVGPTDMERKKEAAGMHILPADIERTSMAIITEELRDRGIMIPEEHAAVVKRVIHTTADFDYAENLRFTEGAVQKAVKALTGDISENSCEIVAESGKTVDGAEVRTGGSITIVTDTNMALAGVSKPSLAKLGIKACCFMAEQEIRELAAQQGCTRASASMLYAAERFPNGIFAVGNAPTALLKLEELIRDGLRPALIIGVPVGFVNVVESKERIFSACEEYGIPAIVAFGRKGGSNVAAAMINALLYTAADMLDPALREPMNRSRA